MSSTSSTYRTTYHHDGTVTLWDVYAQAWQRLDVTTIAAETMATLSQAERARIERMRLAQAGR